MSTDPPSHPGPSLGAVRELRTLAAALHGVDAAAAAAEWGDDAALTAAARIAATRELMPTPEVAAANVVVAVRLARSAVAEAVAQVALARQVTPQVSRIGVIRGVGPVLPGLRRCC